jgi:hypothetical protein
MVLTLKKTIGFVILVFLISILIEFLTDKDFSSTFFIKKTISTFIAGLFYFFIMYYFSKKSK